MLFLMVKTNPGKYNIYTFLLTNCWAKLWKMLENMAWNIHAFVWCIMSATILSTLWARIGVFKCFSEIVRSPGVHQDYTIIYASLELILHNLVWPTRIANRSIQYKIPLTLTWLFCEYSSNTSRQTIELCEQRWAAFTCTVCLFICLSKTRQYLEKHDWAET